MFESIRIHLLPGGILPERKTEGAIGYDVYLRAIVSATEMDETNPALRKMIFDFTQKPAAERLHIREVDGKLVYRLNPGEAVLGGIGFVTEMSFPMFYWVAPRSGLAARDRIQVTNAPGTVDPDYRGEAGVAIKNDGDKPFDLKQHMRIAQIIFTTAIIPKMVEVAEYTDLSPSRRGSGGFGSTGNIG